MTEETDHHLKFIVLFFIICSFFVFACVCSVHAQTADASASFTHARNTLLPVKPITIGQNNQLSTSPPALYDEQLGLTFNQNFTTLAYNITAVAQTDSYGYGPAYLLNGLSNDGYWYQAGLAYNWPYQAGGYNQGFHFMYEVFNSTGQSIYPTNGGGGLQSFTGSVNPYDLVLLNLSFNNGIVNMFAKDWNTSATSYQTYSDNQTTSFIGLSTLSNSNGFFTGPMTEWYHANPYIGDESQVTFSDNSFAKSYALMWMDEWEPSNSSGWSGNTISAGYKNST